MNYVDTFRANLANGDFDPNTASKQDIRTAQLLLGTNADGVWGNKSQAALDAYKKSYNGPVKFNWGGMEGNEAAQAYSAWDTDRIQAEERFAANEQRIEELKQEYLALQQEQETATEDLERNVAANRAGIGDTAQYNSWRARVEAREASKQAREADSEATLRRAKSKLNNALIARSYARGDQEKAVARQVYDDELAAYNELARKLGAPEISASELSDEKTYTKGDVLKMGLDHRDEKGEWDSRENLNKAIEAANTLPDDEKIEVLRSLLGNITKEEGDAKRNAYDKAVRTEAAKLKGSKPGNTNIVVNGNSIPALVRASATNPDKYEVVVDRKVVYDWPLED